LRTDTLAVTRRINVAGTLEKRSPLPDGWHVVNVIVDATALVAGIAATARILTGNRPVSVELIVPDHPVMVMTDPVILRRIVIDLAVNALRSTERGMITIALKVIGSTPEIVFTDTGAGFRSKRLVDLPAATGPAGNIKPEIDAKLDPCLNVSRDDARLIGGSVSARSVYGRGASITLTLPLCPAERRRDLYTVD
jgi:signal transduction histidine kinase